MKQELLIWVIKNLIVALIAVPIIIYLIKKLIDSKASELSLKRERNDLRKDHEILKTLNETLLEKADNKFYDEYRLSKYTHDKTLGIYIHKGTKAPYCPKCLIEKKLDTPLQEFSTGFTCKICDKTYWKPKSSELPREGE